MCVKTGKWIHVRVVRSLETMHPRCTVRYCVAVQPVRSSNSSPKPVTNSTYLSVKPECRGIRLKALHCHRQTKVDGEKTQEFRDYCKANVTYNKQMLLCLWHNQKFGFIRTKSKWLSQLLLLSFTVSNNTNTNRAQTFLQKL